MYSFVLFVKDVLEAHSPCELMKNLARVVVQYYIRLPRVLGLI